MTSSAPRPFSTPSPPFHRGWRHPRGCHLACEAGAVIFDLFCGCSGLLWDNSLQYVGQVPPDLSTLVSGRHQNRRCRAKMTAVFRKSCGLEERMAKLTTPQRLQMRLAHLGMIQGVIGRMAGYSAAVKTFSVTLSVAVIALTADGKGSSLPPWVIPAIIACFALLDAYYLSLEQCFRGLYDEVVDRDLDQAENLHISLSGRGCKTTFRSFFSFSVVGFFVPLVFILFMALTLASANDRRQQVSSRPPASPAAEVVRPAGGHPIIGSSPSTGVAATNAPATVTGGGPGGAGQNR